ncbi:UDP-N-acetylmuramoyl-L-alanine--D-glutamate ligase [Caldalkalibacillus salinus]|uniref:UDP-N-acetylmuramoyl-L-alanine--D-glutamate ligase n=1 Tax=Caldalkalibacillus salinus TaxID=2803787 RepID=UPI001924F77E|nr:UDP-N-acetylmuramoyl-L-alanine--D-glutamate ligase [Caldalkalibacillus salinus]
MRDEAIVNYQQQHILVLGLAKSGRTVAKLLLRLGAKVTVNERKERHDCEGVTELEECGARVVCGGHPLSLLEEDVSLIVKNPGIPFDIPFLQQAEKKGIPVMTEVEIAYQLSEAPIIGITGTNGKTTTTTLIYEMLKDNRHDPLIAGNIGTVLSEVASEATDEQVIVAELSSFQLLGTLKFRPIIALMLNLYDAHLNYHHTRAHYVASKGKIFKNQTEKDIAVLNADQNDVVQFRREIRSDIVWFSMESEVSKGCYLSDGRIVYKNTQREIEIILPISEVALIGRHNLQNVIAAVSVAKAAGAHSERIREVLRTFQGIKHRLQFVRELKGVRYYNDSKATNAQATRMALESFNNNIILIAGGLDRGEDFKELHTRLAHCVKGVVAYGQIAKKITEVAKEAGVKDVMMVDNVKDAVTEASVIAQTGDTVLLSPAAASWDQFASFEERGDMFIQSVHNL